MKKARRMKVKDELQMLVKRYSDKAKRGVKGAQDVADVIQDTIDQLDPMKIVSVSVRFS